MAAHKPPTARAVSALLGNAGFEKSVSSPSRIRGLRNWSPGCRVQTSFSDDAKVIVKHMTFSRTSLDDAQKRQELARYAEAVRTARPGWTVTESEPGSSPELTVSAPEPNE